MRAACPPAGRATPLDQRANRPGRPPRIDRATGTAPGARRPPPIRAPARSLDWPDGRKDLLSLPLNVLGYLCPRRVGSRGDCSPGTGALLFLAGGGSVGSVQLQVPRGGASSESGGRPFSCRRLGAFTLGRRSWSSHARRWGPRLKIAEVHRDRFADLFLPRRYD